MAHRALTLSTLAWTVTQYFGVHPSTHLSVCNFHESWLLSFAADVFTEGLMLLARSINPSAPTLFHPQTVKLSTRVLHATHSAPKKLEWAIENTPELRAGIRFAETRLSDLICQNDCAALEFRGYGKIFITTHGFSPDAFVQMAFQAAYFGMYGTLESPPSIFEDWHRSGDQAGSNVRMSLR